MCSYRLDQPLLCVRLNSDVVGFVKLPNLFVPYNESVVPAITNWASFRLFDSRNGPASQARYLVFETQDTSNGAIFRVSVH